VAVRIEPFSAVWTSEIARLNARLDAAKVDPNFRLPVEGRDELPLAAEPTEPVTKRQYLVVDGSEVRGGFILQEQRCDLAGQAQWVANIQMPLSEGVIDRRYALVALRMLSLILESRPFLFAVGMGGSLDQPFARLVSTMKWPIGLVPFAFYVVHPARFLRNIGLGRSSPARAALTTAAASSGLGWLGLRLLHGASGAWRRLGTERPRRVTCDRVTVWGDWADGVWNGYRNQCSFAAVRDRCTLPLFHDLALERLRAYRFLDDDGHPVGWAAIQLRAMIGSPHFGDLTVATVLDLVAWPGWEESVTRAVTWLATEADADLIVSNQYHRVWRAAQLRAGFLEGPSNYLLAFSPHLAAVLGSLDRSYERVHVTRADGDGRVNL
jgi:hypothetical protein